MPKDSIQLALPELVQTGWAAACAALASAGSEQALVVHWFLTPNDANVHVDEHFGDNQRTSTFLRVVVPTLADRLEAEMLWVAVPWEANGRPEVMALLAVIKGQAPVLEARLLAPAANAEGPPWWQLGAELPAPAELTELAQRLRI